MNNNITKGSLLPKLEEFLERQISTASKAIVEKHMQQIKDEVEQERVKIVATAGLNVAKNMRLEYLRDELHIVITDRREDV